MAGVGVMPLCHAPRLERAEVLEHALCVAFRACLGGCVRLPPRHQRFELRARHQRESGPRRGGRSRTRGDPASVHRLACHQRARRHQADAELRSQIQGSHRAWWRVDTVSGEPRRALRKATVPNPDSTHARSRGAHGHRPPGCSPSWARAGGSGTRSRGPARRPGGRGGVQGTRRVRAKYRPFFGSRCWSERCILSRRTLSERPPP